MIAIANISRRGLLQGASIVGFVLALRAGTFSPFGEAEAAEASTLAPNVYLSIDPSGIVTITAHRSEMGTGIRTNLPLVLADELEADWTKVKIVQATGDKKYGDQNTDGSRSVRQFYQVMRQAGATARQMLEAAAAKQWGVAAEDCHASNHVVIHEPSKRQVGFGDLVAVAATLPVPASDQLRLKTKDQRRYVGKPMPAVDLQDIVRGKAVFGMDVVVPGMKHASIERCPVYGGTVKTYDAAEALKIPGVERVEVIPTAKLPAGFLPLGGIAVIATNTWSAQQGRQKLKIEWDYGPNASYDSTAYRTALETTAKKPGKIARNEGDVDTALGSAAKRIAADYYVPHMAHAQMEPVVAVAHVTDGHCEAWAPTQNPQGARTTVAQVLGLDEAAVTINVTLLGGGFGRKSKPDYVAEAAVLSKTIGAPVKVTWTREDDIQHGYYHAVSAQHLEGGLDEKGHATAWLHRTVFPSIASTFTPNTIYGSPGELGQGVVDMPYAIDNVRCENGPAEAHVRIGWYRSVYNIPHAFAVGSFVDELAHAAGRDPVEFITALLGPDRRIDLKAKGVQYGNYGASIDQYPIDTARLRGVVELAAKESGWSTALPARSGRGIAVHRSFVSYVAAVVQVRIAADGTIAVPRMDLAIDCGLVINPDRVRAQVEGAAIMGIGNALYSAITMKNGQVEQSNLADYLVARMDIAPETHVHIVPSEAPPGGVGEPGVPPVAPALCNAIFAATGTRIRALPVQAELLKSA